VKPSERKSSDLIIRLLRCVSIAAIVILFSVVPLAKDIVPVQSVREEMKASVSSEPKPVTVTREDEKHEVRTANTKTESSSSKRQSRRQVTQKKQEKPVVNTRTVTANKAPQKTVPYDKVFSLVQTGQRALKENTSVINIKK
jgi:FtsZ-interacting cell division protein YlmF